MSEENVDVVRELFDAFWRRRDPEASAALISPDTEWVTFMRRNLDADRTRSPSATGSSFTRRCSAPQRRPLAVARVRVER
jgi:ketosteroid isomerase-like protein